MNKLELSKLLTTFSLVDHRNVDPETVNAWYDVLGDLDVEFAYQAGVDHFRDSTEYLKPAHIVAGTRKLQQRNALDVQEARSRGVIGSDWPDTKKLPVAAVEALQADRVARRGVIIGGTWFETHDAYRQSVEQRSRDALPNASMWLGGNAEPAAPEYLR
ncbi:hypothetical protein C1N91_07590 [Curtobacterium sp. SGAir0471]|uniref:hypothetical protein n=1 Tax=Curtobacterium sp. SGAir0471 TaxID=2070337 RepID=UPI0010CD1F57|nr:hypothetical protein [Curtobacterium sp. SGAir0471]QCR43430.1 hypothetical protein C1N91_07590 [Curtobacterium sp. SGAir0471]